MEIEWKKAQEELFSRHKLLGLDSHLDEYSEGRFKPLGVRDGVVLSTGGPKRKKWASVDTLFIELNVGDTDFKYLKPLMGIGEIQII